MTLLDSVRGFPAIQRNPPERRRRETQKSAAALTKANGSVLKLIRFSAAGSSVTVSGEDEGAAPLSTILRSVGRCAPRLSGGLGLVA